MDIFFVVFFIALVLAIVSLFTPKTAFFLKNKTKSKAFWSWLGIAILAAGIGSALHPAKKEEVQQASAPVQQIQTLPYSVVKQEEVTRAAIQRNRLDVVIIPTGDQAEASQEALANTVMQVALKLQQETSLPVVTVNMICQKAANAFGESQLAMARYIPDGKGISGKDNSTPVWEVSAAKRGFTAQELEYLRLWAEMRDSFQKDGMTDEKALRDAIEKRMNVAPGSINPFGNVPEKMAVQ